MGLYLDSANLDDARRGEELGFLDGVTTNPTLIALTGRPGMDVLQVLLNITSKDVFYQVSATTVEGRTAQAWEAHRLSPERVVIKVPAASDNLPMIAKLTSAGVRVLLTAVSSPAQAFMAVQVKCDYVAPYVNRLTRQLGNGVAIVRDIASILQGTKTRILAASLKSTEEVTATLLAGAHDVTIPLPLILAMGDHELSQKAIDEFAAHNVTA